MLPLKALVMNMHLLNFFLATIMLHLKGLAVIFAFRNYLAPVTRQLKDLANNMHLLELFSKYHLKFGRISKSRSHFWN